MNAVLSPTAAAGADTDVWPILQRTIGEVCRLRGDDDTNHQALIDECAARPAEMRVDLLAHFQDLARLYRVALNVPALAQGSPAAAAVRVRP